MTITITAITPSGHRTHSASYPNFAAACRAITAFLLPMAHEVRAVFYAIDGHTYDLLTPGQALVAFREKT